jgi:hypothetical protein
MTTKPNALKPSTSANTTTSIADLDKALAQLRTLAAEVSKHTLGLDPISRRRALKFRTGGEAVVQRIASLTERYGTSSTQTSSKDAAAKLQVIGQLVPLQTELTSLLQRVSDTLLSVRSDCWHTTVFHYSVLEALSRKNPDLRSELLPVQEFFSTGKRKVKVPAVKAA